MEHLHNVEIFGRGVSRTSNCRSRLEYGVYAQLRGVGSVVFPYPDLHSNVVHVITLPKWAKKNVGNMLRQLITLVNTVWD